MSEDGQTTAIGESDVRQWIESLSNWGRWGANDRRGTLNFITPQKRMSALRAVRQGLTVSCGWDIRHGDTVGNRVAPQRWMARTGLGHNDPEPPTGRLTVDGDASTASEFISMVFHGVAITHLDALSHVHWRGKMYGGVPSSYVTDRDGATVHDVREASQGIQTRGVLLDIARLRGHQSLPIDYAITPADLEDAERAQGVRVESGDVLLVRTGDGRRRLTEVGKAHPSANRSGSTALPGSSSKSGWDPVNNGQPGLHAACLPWLHEREVAALGSDGPQEVRPSPFQGMALPVHTVAIVAMGMWLLDNCQLEDLAAECDNLQQWSFLFTASPVRLVGATGSPVNPLATL